MKRLGTLRSFAVTGVFSLAAAGCATVRSPKPAEAPPPLIFADGCAVLNQVTRTLTVSQACLDSKKQERQGELAAVKMRADKDVAEVVCEKTGKRSALCFTARLGTYGQAATIAMYKTELASETAAPSPALQARARHLVHAQHAEKPVASATPASPADAVRPSTLNKVTSFAKKSMPTVAGTAASVAMNYGAKAILAHFCCAAAVTTLPAVAAVAVTIAGSAAMFALVGGTARVFRRYLKERNDDVIRPPVSSWHKEKWVLKEFGRGALWGGIMGTVTGGLGVAITDYVNPNGWLHSIFHGHQAVHIAAPAAPLAPAAVTHGSGIATVLAPADIKGLLTPDQLKDLPQSLQKLAGSQNTKDILVFCKEASYRLINGPHHDVQSIKAGAQLIQRGLDLAAKNDIHNHLVEKLQADMSFLKASGLGTDKDVCSALKHARQAGAAIHNYAGRLMRVFPHPACGT